MLGGGDTPYGGDLGDLWLGGSPLMGRIEFLVQVTGERGGCVTRRSDRVEAWTLPRPGPD